MLIEKVKAIAKINVGLNVISKRPDGFHNLETIFYPIHDLYDVLSFEKSESFYFENEFSFNNIIVKALSLLEKYSNRKINLKISLDKNIPIGAGLGGGSSDAAYVLTSVNKILNLKLTPHVLMEIALELGSDVPFFLNPISSLGTSRGEVLMPIDFKIDFPILLVNPGINVSTKDAFSNVLPMTNKFDYKNISDLNILKYKSTICNDFEQSVFEQHPEIRMIKELMISKGAIFSLMSGTGSTVYGIFSTLKDAFKCKSYFPKTYFSFISKPNNK